ncbi:MAG TPA: Gfo/Idh/MocA family oxidoreductase [Clostridiales bacterium]|nr:Gfo/Idh/MocA family oxidoreductase [Clostridiales bacterium]
MKRFAVIGCGFWSQYQIAAWKEVGGVELVAVYNRTKSRAQAIADRFGIPKVYDTVEELLDNEKLDFVDIITDVDTHEKFTLLAAGKGVPVICQKPMAPSLEAAERMVSGCKKAGVPFYIHENWRWQLPIRALKQKLDEGIIGKPFRARITYSNSFPVFDNQPFLAELEQFILTDIGVHVLDVARFLFGEAETLYCQIAKVHKNIKGEDVATLSMKMKSGMHLTVELSYASKVEHDRFPETFIHVEGEQGSIELAPDYWLRTTTREATVAKRINIPYYPWVDSRYEVVHTSIVEANRNLLAALNNEGPAETTGKDNLKTLKLVFAAYESAKRNAVVEIK